MDDTGWRSRQKGSPVTGFEVDFCPAVTAFRREKFVPRGGPSGGDGGVGGSVWIESSEGLNTLLHLRYNPEHKAERGRHGEGSNRFGKDGEDAIVKVPVGTQIFDAET